MYTPGLKSGLVGLVFPYGPVALPAGSGLLAPCTVVPVCRPDAPLGAALLWGGCGRPAAPVARTALSWRQAPERSYGDFWFASPGGFPGHRSCLGPMELHQLHNSSQLSSCCRAHPERWHAVLLGGGGRFWLSPRRVRGTSSQHPAPCLKKSAMC